MTGEPDALDLREQYHIIAWVLFKHTKNALTCLITFVKPFPVVLLFFFSVAS